MFDNVGKTLFQVGQVLFWLFIICGSLLFLFYVIEGLALMGIVMLICGVLSSLLFALPIMGFGKLVEDVHQIRNRLAASSRPQSAPRDELPEL